MHSAGRLHRSSCNASKMASSKGWFTPLYILGMVLALSLFLDAVDAGHFYTVNRQKALQRFGKRWSVSPEEERNFAELKNLLENSRQKKSYEIEEEGADDSLEDIPAALKREWRNDGNSADDMVEYEPIIKRAAPRGIPYWLSGDAARFSDGEDGDF